MRLKEHFHWLVLQTVVTPVAGQMLYYPMLEEFVATLREALRKGELNSTFRYGFCNLSRYDFSRCKVSSSSSSSSYLSEFNLGFFLWSSMEQLELKGELKAKVKHFLIYTLDHAQ